MCAVSVMAFAKWQIVITEWVNCLKLVSPITNLSELRDGKFFIELLNKLMSDENFQTTKPDLPCVTFLEKYYPTYFFQSDVDLTDVKEITLLCSLLLHHCSIADGRLEFRSPLCQNMCHSSQTLVKSFLEELQSQKVVTRTQLTDAINKIQKQISPISMKSCAANSTPKSSRHCQSPLQEYFKTPMRKLQLSFEEHSKEIKSLRAQLESERFEKADLEEELKYQQEKNKSLDKKISLKAEEVARLRAELLSVESQCSTCLSETRIYSEEKKLKEEIISLEKYIEILHKEQEDLQLEKDVIKDKLSRMEDQCKDWKDKVLEADSTMSKLSQDSDKQLQELKYLREHCEELTVMLAELRPSRNTSEDSFEVDAVQDELNKSSAIDYENLASTVVDKQLLNARYENTELKKNISALESSNQDLQAKIRAMDERLSVVSKENDELAESNRALNEKVNVLIETQTKLDNSEQALHISLAKISELTNDNEDLTLNLNILNTTLQKCCDDLNKAETKIGQLTTDANNYKESCTSLESRLTACQATVEKLTNEYNDKCKALEVRLSDERDRYVRLSEERDQLETKLEDAVKRISIHENEHYVLKTLFDRYKSDLDGHLGKFTELVSFEGSDQFGKVEKLFEAVERLKVEHGTSLNRLNDEIVELNARIVGYESDEAAMQRNIEGLNDLLKDAQSKIDDYVNVVVVDYDSKIRQLEETVKEKCDNIEELRVAAQVKDGVVGDLQAQVGLYQNNIDDLNGRIDQQLIRLTQQDDEINAMRDRLVDVERDRGSLEEARDDLLRKIAAMDSDFAVKSERHESDVGRLQTCIDELNGRVGDQSATLERNDRRIWELENNAVMSSKRIDDLLAEISAKSNEINDYQSKVMDQEVNINEGRTQRDNLKIEYERDVTRLNAQIADKNAEIGALEGRISEGDAQCRLLEDKVRTLINTVEDLNVDVSTKEAAETTYKGDIDKYVKELHDLMILVSELQAEVLALNKTIGETEAELVNVRVANADLSEAHASDIKRFETVIDDLRTHADDLKRHLDHAVSQKHEIEDELVSCHTQFAAKKIAYDQQQTELKQMTDELNANMSDQIRLKDKLISDNYNEIRLLKEKLQLLRDKSAEQDKKIADKEQEVRDVIQKLDALSRQNDELVSQKNYTISELEVLRQQIDILEKLKAQLEGKCVTLNDSLAVATQNFEVEHKSLENKHRELTSDFAKLETQRDALLVVLAQHERKINEVTQTYENTISNLNDKISCMESDSARMAVDLNNLRVAEGDLIVEMNATKEQLADVINDFNAGLERQVVVEREHADNVSRLSKAFERYGELENTYVELALKVESIVVELTLRRLYCEDLKAITSQLKGGNTNERNAAELDALVHENDDLISKINVLLHNVTKIKTQTRLPRDLKHIEQTTNEFVTNIGELNEYLSLFVDENERITTTYNNYIKHNRIVLNEIYDNYNNDLVSIISQNKELSAQLADKNVEMAQAETKYDAGLQELNNQITDRQDAIAKLEAQISALVDDKSKLTDDRLTVETELVELRRSYEALDADRRSSHVSEMRSMRTRLEVILKIVEGACASIDADVQYATEQLDTESASLDKLNMEFVQQVEWKDDVTETLRNEVDALTSKIARLQTEKNNLKNNVVDLNNKFMDLENNMKEEIHQQDVKLAAVRKDYDAQLDNYKVEVVPSLEALLDERGVDLSKKIAEVSNLNVKFLETVRRVECLEREKGSLQQCLEERAAEIDLLEAKRSELVDVVSKLKFETEQSILATHEHTDAIKSELKRYVDMFENEKDARASLDFKLAEETKKVDFLNDQVKSLASDKKTVVDLCVSVANNIHALRNVIANDSAQPAPDKNIIFALTDEEIIAHKLEVLYAEMKVVDSECKHIMEGIAVLKNENIGFITERDNLTSKIIDYENMMRDYNTIKAKCELTSKYEDEINILQREIADLNRNNTDLSIMNAECRSEISKKSAENAEVVQKLNTLIKTHSEEVVKLQSICENWQKLYTENESAYNQLKINFKSLEDKYNERTAEVDNLKRSIDEYRKINLKLEQQNIDSNSLISTSELVYDNLKKSYEELLQQHKLDKQEITKLRNAYSDLMSDISRLQLDCSILKKTVEERNAKICELTSTKEQYEKLMEETNKVNMELDTIRYKRTRDKEEFKRLLEEERGKHTSDIDSQIQEVRNEYELKLAKMKEKIVRLYKEEVEKERLKVVSEEQDHAHAVENIAKLKSQLWMTSSKYTDIKKENELLLNQIQDLNKKVKGYEKSHEQRHDLHRSKESMGSLRDRRELQSVVSERRVSTLPRGGQNVTVDLEESVTFSRRQSVTSVQASLEQGLKMEDEEGELFNNTYLADLKAGRCNLPIHKDLSASRLSELQYRNSLCLPHLKSSYPAEMQFTSPEKFKEDDIKMGNVDLDDSMSSILLPGDKPRLKKDRNQTSYKKPGPPTPSKNGGRLSLQGSEIREILREPNDNVKVQKAKATTPSRIKALFMGRSAHQQDSENQPPTPKGKRLSLFRKPR